MNSYQSLSIRLFYGMVCLIFQTDHWLTQEIWQQATITHRRNTYHCLQRTQRRWNRWDSSTVFKITNNLSAERIIKKKCGASVNFRTWICGPTSCSSSYYYLWIHDQYLFITIPKLYEHTGEVLQSNTYIQTNIVWKKERALSLFNSQINLAHLVFKSILSVRDQDMWLFTYNALSGSNGPGIIKPSHYFFWATLHSRWTCGILLQWMDIWKTWGHLWWAFSNCHSN